MHLICPPKFCISMVFNFSWEGGNNSRNEKQRLYRILGGNLRYIIEDVQVANRPVSQYQNSYLALGWGELSLEARYEFNNNLRKRPSIQGFWYFARLQSLKTHKYMQNITKFAKNLIKYNIFKTYLGYWGCLIDVHLQIYLDTSSLQWAHNVPKLPGINYVAKNWAQVMMLKALPFAHFSSTLWIK